MKHRALCVCGHAVKTHALLDFGMYQRMECFHQKKDGTYCKCRDFYAAKDWNEVWATEAKKP